MASFTHNNLDDIIQEFIYPVPINSTPNLEGLLETGVSENRRIDLDIESLYDDRFIDTATGRELEKMAFEVGVRRNTGEVDDALRRRVFGQYAAQSSDSTYENFAQAAVNILDTDGSNISLSTPPDTTEKNVLLETDGSIINDNPLSESQIISLLEESNSAPASVTVSKTGTFAFDTTENDGLSGWDNGTWSDIV